MAAAGAAAGAAIENEIYRKLFVDKFPGTEFLEPSEICSYFKINDVWNLSEEKASHDVRVVASLQFHSLQILSPTRVSEGVYHANLEYEDVANVTRITGADLVPQHAYYYLVMKIYELFLHPDASESMFRQDMEHIAQFITDQLNSGLADGRAFFEDKVRRYLQSHPHFLQHTDAQKLQSNINAIWDLLRSEEYKNAGSTVQKGIVSTISPSDVEEYSLEDQGRVSDEGTAAFKKTVYGFHVLVYVGGHVISMSLSRVDLFHGRSGNVCSFFNSNMIKYMASKEFMKQVHDIIEQYNTLNYKRDGGPVPFPQLDNIHLTFVECGCKSPGLLHYDSTGKLTLTTETKLPGRREHIVGQAGDRSRYILVDNFPLPGSMNTTLYVTSSDGFPNLPNFCEYDYMDIVHRVLGIKFGKDDFDSMKTEGDSPPQLYLLLDSPQPSDPVPQPSDPVMMALVNASRGAPTVQEVVPVAASGPAGGLFGRVRSGLGTACNFIRGIFFPHTPTCSAEDSAKDYANIGFRDHVVFCAPTKSEDSAIKGLPGSTRWDVVRAAVSVRRKSMAMTRLPWSEAREFFLEKDDSHRGGRRPVSRKYRNNKKNISRKKEKKRMSLRHRRSRRRLRRRSHSLCLKN